MSNHPKNQATNPTTKEAENMGVLFGGSHCNGDTFPMVNPGLSIRVNSMPRRKRSVRPCTCSIALMSRETKTQSTV